MGVKTGELGKLGKDRSYISGQLHVATVARLHPAKGHLHALAAVNRAHQSGLKSTTRSQAKDHIKKPFYQKVARAWHRKSVTLSGTFRKLKFTNCFLKSMLFCYRARTGRSMAGSQLWKPWARIARDCERDWRYPRDDHARREWIFNTPER